MAQGKSDGTVYIDTRVDTKGFGKGMNSMKSQVGGLTGTFKKLGVAIGAAFAIKQLIQFGQKSIELGSDLQEVENVVGSVFTTMSDQVDEFAKNAAETAGLSETMAKRYTGTFGAMAKAFGFAESESFAMSTALTQLAGDVASFYNITQDEAYTKLKSVFTGETETLKDLGVVMTQSALDSFAMAEGLGKTTKQMSEQEKVALRYRFVMNQLSTASGDFLRTSDSWANQTRLLKLNLESIMATFGQGLINFFTPVIKLINTLLSKVATLANAFKAFSEMIMGTSSGGGGSGAGQASLALGDLEEGYGDVADSAKNAANATEKANKANNKYLTGLDELNVLSKENGSNEQNTYGNGIGGDLADFGKINTDGEKTNTIFDALIEKAKELADIFKKGFFDGFGDFQPRWETIKNSLESIKNSMIEIFTDSAVTESSHRFLDSFVYMLGQITGSIASIGFTMAANLLGGFAKCLKESKDRIKKHLVTIFNIGTEINTIMGNYASAIAYIFEAFAGENGQKLTANIIGIFANAFMGIIELYGKFGRDIINIITKPFIDNEEKFRTAFDGILGILAEGTGIINQILNDGFGKLNEMYDQYFKPFFDSLAESISIFTGIFLDFLNGDWSIGWQYAENIIKEFANFLRDVFSPDFTEIFGPVLGEALNSFFKNIQDVWNRVKEIFAGIIHFIEYVFTGNWQGAWRAVKDIFEGIWHLMLSVMKSPINGIIGMVNSLIDGVTQGINAIIDLLNNLSFDIPDWVPEYGGKTFGFDILKITPPKIPYLATGAVIPPNAPFMAMLGDQTHGRNLEAPEDLIRQIVREEAGVNTQMLDVLLQIAQNTRETAEKELTIGDREIARANLRGQSSMGFSLITEG